MDDDPTAGGARVRDRSNIDSRPSACRRGYDRRWRTARKAFLAEHPICLYCLAEGQHTPADCIDHNPPHRGDHAAFWKVATWVPACKVHNDRFGVLYDGALGRPIKPRPPAPKVVNSPQLLALIGALAG